MMLFMKLFHCDFATFEFAALAADPLSTRTVAEMERRLGYPEGL